MNELNMAVQKNIPALFDLFYAINFLESKYAIDAFQWYINSPSKLPNHPIMQLQSLTEKVVETGTILGQAFKEKIENFKNDAFAQLKDISIEKFLDLLSTLKPLNFTLILSNYVTAQSATEKFSVLMCLFELFGDFWKDGILSIKNLLLYSLISVFDYILKKCWSSARDLLGCDFEYMDCQSIDIKEDGLLNKVLNQLGLKDRTLHMDEEQSFLATVVVILGMIICGGSITALTKNSFEKVLKRLNKVSSSLKSIHNLQEYLPKVWDNCLDALGRLLGFEHITKDTEILEFTKKLIDYKAKVMDLHETIKQRPWQILQCPDKIKEIEEGYKEVDTIYLQLMKVKANMSSTKHLFDEMKEVLKGLREYVSKVKHATASKQEPFLMIIAGKPGIGKSQMITALVNAIAAELQIPATTFLRNSAVKHWDNYIGQTFIVYDDFGAVKTDLDHGEVMMFKNPNKTILSMADVPDKGTQFSSVGVIAATNEISVNSSAVVKCSEALDRRFEIRIIAVDPNFDAFVEQHKMSPGDWESENHPAKATILSEDGQEIPYYDKDKFTHLQFFKAPSYLCPNAEEKEVSFDEIVQICCNHYRSYFEKFQASLTVPVVNRMDATHDQVQTLLDGAVKFNVQDETVTLPSTEEEIEELEGAVGGIDILNALDQVETASTSTATTDSNTSLRRKRIQVSEVHKHMGMEAARRIIKDSTDKKAQKLLVEGKITPEEYAKGTIKWDAVLVKENQKKRNEIISEMMTKEGYSRTQAQRVYNDRYKFQLQTRVNQPFMTVAKPENPIILFVGDPGTGKSFAQRALHEQFPDADWIHGGDLATTPARAGVLFVEDASVSEIGFRAFEQYVCKVYDGESHITGIVASINPDIAMQWLPNLEAQQRFFRRCTIFEFRWAIKEKNYVRKSIKYAPRDLTSGTPHASCVKITTSLDRERWDLPQMLDYSVARLREASAAQIPIAVSVPYIGEHDIDPDFIVELSSPMEEAFERYYDTPGAMVTDIAKGLVKLKKGSVLDGINIARQFTITDNNQRIRWPGSLDTFIVTVNSSGMCSNKIFSTQITAPDCKLLITPQKTNPRKIVMFRLAEDVHVKDNCETVESNEGEVKLNEASVRVYRDTVLGEPVAEQLKETLDAVAEEITTSVSLKSILDSFPLIKNISGVLMFILNLCIAGMSIHSLLSAAKKRFQGIDYDCEAKGKNKGRKLASRTRNFSIPTQLYNDIKNCVCYYNPSARKMKVKDLVDEYLDFWATKDLDGYDTSTYELRPTDIAEFFRNRNFDTETREEKVVVTKPAVVTLNEPYALEAPFKRKEPKEKLRLPPVEKDLPVSPDNSAPMELERLYDPAVRDMIDIARKADVEIYQEGQESMLCHGVMVHGRIGVTVGHAFSENDTIPMYVQCFNLPKPKKYRIKLQKLYPKVDVAVFEIVDKTCPSYKTILHHFQRKSAMVPQVVENRNAVLVIPNQTNGNTNILPLRLRGEQRIITNQGHLDGFAYANPVTYLAGALTKSPINTQMGDCGSLVIVNDPGVPQKFLGIHNAGNAFEAHASFVFQDMIDLKMELECANEKSKALISPHHELDIRDLTRESLLGMPIVGLGDLQVHRPMTTNLWTSPLKMQGDSSYQPSIVFPFDDRNTSGQDPYYMSVAKWNNLQPAIDEPILDSCIDDVIHMYGKHIQMANVETKVLTKTEAINSGKNYNVMPINRKSAAGYPWFKYGKKEAFLVNKGTGNEAYFGIDLTKKSGQKLNASIDYLINVARHPGQHVKVPFSGWLKDEPLKMSKIETVNTRSFAGAPFDYTIAYRMYFATIYGAIHAVRDKMPIQVGINPTSMEWDLMVTRLLSCSSSGFDLDFKGFDAKVPALIQQKLVKIHNGIAQMTDPNWKIEDDVIREGLHQALVKPLIICPMDGKTYVLQAPGGQPSGHPGTADDNSLIHLVYLLYAYKKVMIAKGRSELATLMHFMDKVQAIIYGDDGVYMVHPDIQEYFNFETVEVVMRSLGNECTPAAKNGKIQKIIPLVECEFLKRSFIRKGKFWFGALKEKSFEKMLGYCLGPSHHWFRDQSMYFGRPADLKATADSCLSEAAIHGRSFFDQMSKHLERCFRDSNIDYFPYRYEDVVQRLELPLPL